MGDEKKMIVEKRRITFLDGSEGVYKVPIYNKNGKDIRIALEKGKSFEVVNLETGLEEIINLNNVVRIIELGSFEEDLIEG